MIIPVLPNKIPKIWEQIKFATTEVDGIKEEHRQVFLNKLLQELLAGRMRCFVTTNSSGKIKLLAIIKICISNFTGQKHMVLQSFYAFEKSTDEEWKTLMDTFKELAIQEKCVFINAKAKNSQAAQKVIDNGFNEIFKGYSFELGAL